MELEIDVWYITIGSLRIANINGNIKYKRAKSIQNQRSMTSFEQTFYVCMFPFMFVIRKPPIDTLTIPNTLYDLLITYYSK